MPPKRKSEIPEASPPSPNKKSKTPSKATSEKKRRSRSNDDIGTDVESTSVRSKKKKSDSADSSATPSSKTPKPRKTAAKKAAADESESESETKQARKSATTAKKAPRTATKTVAPKTEKKTASKPRVSRKSIMPTDLEGPPSSSFSSSSSSSSSGGISSPITLSNNKSNNNGSAVSQKVVAYSTPSPTLNKLADETEIMSLWNQSLSTLLNCMTIIGPMFMIIILTAYVFGKIHNSQAIASVGIVYTLLFMIIMGSYVLATLPFILISRVFTSIVAPHAQEYTPKQINFFCRLLALTMIVIIGVGYKMIA